MQLVILAEQRAQAAAGFVCLVPTLRGEFHSMVGHALVDFAILVSFRLGMADENYHLHRRRKIGQSVCCILLVFLLQ
jgi:hypothetical protein